ncbi:sterol desaturase family protein [Desertivirga brevis]|uniref:sterol desaturase family protein n=1 Tax=Desertivirga brevis TaxID=2810310 RepID=UPI001A9581CC|nr:sterol desaturase family protein [Pedobacter sp. SYSU D00873]
MGVIRRNFDYIGSPVLAGLFAVLFVLESKFQLRRRVQNRWKRVKVNAQVAVPSFALLRFIFLPLMVKLASRNQHICTRLGYFLPSHLLRQILAFFFLDYTNYLWHILNHKIPLLWRFHLVHHIDKDLDLTTAFRFHFGELIGSIFYRGAFTYLSGATPLTVIIYEIAFEAATEFHHSNTRLPLQLEQTLNKVMVTPRMHGIHHSVNKCETNSNFSVIFSFWDRLHGTLNLNVNQDDLIIGVAEYPGADKFKASELLMMPLMKG